MEAGDIFHKTAKGQTEIELKSDALSMKDRRVLILVNGENDAATLQRLSLCENIAEILDNLVRLGFIEQTSSAPAPASPAPAPAATSSAEPEPQSEPAQDDTVTEIEVGAREFMCNTLLTFANRVRVGKLIDEITAAADIESVKQMVKPWYHALSETPGGMYQADDLRNEVSKMIEVEEINGLR